MTFLFNLIKKDLKQKQQTFADAGYQTSMFRIFLSDGTSANILYRLIQLLTKYRLSPLAFVFVWLNKVINGCVIGTNTQFKEGLVLMHPNGVVINSKVTGGTGIVIESGVVIGDEKGKAPIIGNNVFIGAGAKIIGGVTIGNNVKIGANAVVVKDLPDDVTAVGIPAKVLKRST